MDKARILAEDGLIQIWMPNGNYFTIHVDNNQLGISKSNNGTKDIQINTGYTKIIAERDRGVYIS